jgi:plasmid stabilization system protein ParE
MQELRAAAAFYSTSSNVDLGRALVDEFDRATNLLLTNPQLGQVWRTGHRRYGLRRFPYLIIYKLTKTEVRVVALAHQRRRPVYWQGRT